MTIYFIGPPLNWRALLRRYDIDPRTAERAGYVRVTSVAQASAVRFEADDRLLVVPDRQYVDVARIMRAKQAGARRRRPYDPDLDDLPPAA